MHKRTNSCAIESRSILLQLEECLGNQIKHSQKHLDAKNRMQSSMNRRCKRHIAALGKKKLEL